MKRAAQRQGLRWAGFAARSKQGNQTGEGQEANRKVQPVCQEPATKRAALRRGAGNNLLNLPIIAGEHVVVTRMQAFDTLD